MMMHNTHHSQYKPQHCSAQSHVVITTFELFLLQVTLTDKGNLVHYARKRGGSNEDFNNRFSNPKLTKLSYVLYYM